jgi:hypothetical protein
MTTIGTGVDPNVLVETKRDGRDKAHWNLVTWSLWLPWLLGAIALAVAAWKLETIASWVGTFIARPQVVLQWFVALLPGAIILHHLWYLLLTRRNQFRTLLSANPKMDTDTIDHLADLHFGSMQMTLRYAIPALLVILLCALSIAAITYPNVYLPWLYAGPTYVPTPTGWPPAPGGEVLRGAAFGFAGAYVYLLLLLTERAFRRDISSGVAIWTAAMAVLGPLSGAVAAVLLQAGAGPAQGESFTRDAVFFVAGMLPRQFSLAVQGQVRRMFSGGATALRTQPLTMIRGIGPEVEARLEEEGIHDVSALAYASPSQLIRATTFAPRQIVDWIDEALLIATLPEHWEALEKIGVTGVMDLAWYQTRPASIGPLAEELRMKEPLLTDVVSRLWQDAQIRDLYQFYWDDEAPKKKGDEDRERSQPGAGESLTFHFVAGLAQDARDRVVAVIKAMPDVMSATPTGDTLTVVVASAQRAARETALRDLKEIEPA